MTGAGGVPPLPPTGSGRGGDALPPTGSGRGGDVPPPTGYGPRRGYWVLPVGCALLLLPSTTATLALAAALAGAVALSLIRSVAARRARAAASAASPDTITLGQNASGQPVRLSDAQLSAHGLIVGASGAGKSTTLLQILSEQIRRGRPVVAIDMKGSPAFARRLAAAAGAAGKPFRVWTPDGGAHWNPLQYGNATELKDKLISSERFSEPHYQRAAERYVQTVLQVLHSSHRDRPATLQEVVELMDPRRLAAALRHRSGVDADRIQDYLASLTPDQLSAVRGLGTRLAIVSESHTGPWLAPGRERTIDLRAALEGHEIVLFSLNASKYGRLSAQLGALAIQDLVAATGERQSQALRDGHSAPQAFVAIDEFSALGEDNVLALLARGREAGVSVLLATQELADLDRAGRGFRDQVLGVTAVKLIHRQDVPSSALLGAQMVGTRVVWEPTYQIGRGPFGSYGTSGGTRRQVERFVIHPNEFMTLRTGQAVQITKVPAAAVAVVNVRPPTGHSAPTPTTAAPVPVPTQTNAGRTTTAPPATARRRSRTVRSPPPNTHHRERPSRGVER
jgi:hypothetical protein